MTERLRIENEDIAVEIIPQLGGSVASFDLKRGAERLPVFRPWSGESESPRTFACIPMVPWFARISGGGIHLDGEFYPIARNDPEDTHPLHGDGWRSPWAVTERSSDRIGLSLRSRAIPPFDYLAMLTYGVSGATLEIRLSIRNCAERPVPYGMGLHPWFPRTPDATLQAVASGTWLEQPPQLPTATDTKPVPPAWNFDTARTLPPDFIDNSFAGWDGRARIEWPSLLYAVAIEADPEIRLSHVYAPGPQFPFFCFEQITNMIDAFNLPGPPEATGLRILAPGDETGIWARFTAERL